VTPEPPDPGKPSTCTDLAGALRRVLRARHDVGADALDVGLESHFAKLGMPRLCKVPPSTIDTSWSCVSGVA
jgi:hypothetical protein